jgi:oligoendopeptidase F
MEKYIEEGLLEKNEAKFKWRLEDIYETEELWLDDSIKVKQMADEVLKYRGKLSTSAKILLTTLQLRDKTMELRDKLWVYSAKRKQEDLKNSCNQAISQKGEKLKSDIGGILSFFEPELLVMPDEILMQFKKEVPELLFYNFYFEKLMRQKLHILSIEEESILSQIGILENSPSNIYGKIEDADITTSFIIEDKDGNKTKVLRNQCYSMLESNDRNLRLAVFNEKYKYYIERKHTLSETYLSVVKKDMIISKIRKHSSSIEGALFNDNVSVDIYNNLITTVHNNLNTMHRFINVYKT